MNKILISFVLLALAGQLYAQSDSTAITEQTKEWTNPDNYTIRETGAWIDKKRDGWWKTYQRHPNSGVFQLQKEQLYRQDQCIQLKEYVYNDPQTEWVEYSYCTYYQPSGEVFMEEMYLGKARKQWMRRYENKEKRYETYYHDNGAMSSEGWSVYALVTSGCDAGSHLFQHTGKWKIYNEYGKLTDVQHYPHKPAH